MERWCIPRLQPVLLPAKQAARAAAGDAALSPFHTCHDVDVGAQAAMERREPREELSAAMQAPVGGSVTRTCVAA